MVDVVIVGLGYVGLPLAVEAARRGLTVVGLDVTERTVESLNAGRSHVDDVTDETIAEIVAAGFRATTDPAVVQDAATVVICVPTPLSNDGGPDLSAVEGACRSIAPHLRSETLVVLESTTYPGTTAEVVRPLLEELSGLDESTGLLVAYSPERVDPGNATYGLRNTPKVVGGDSPAALAAVSKFYGRFVETVVEARGTREAEAAKLLENTYRHVNIALVNEMVRFFHELEIDFWDVVGLAETKPFGFQAFRPGPGVGGHCIPIDPNYLSHRVRTQLGYAFRFVELAQEINASMPAYVATRAAEALNDLGKPVRGSRILLLGLTYKPNISDLRESPAKPLAERLLAMGGEVIAHDPFMDDWHLVPAATSADRDPVAAARDADLTILLQNHRAYDVAAIAEAAPAFLDTRGVVDVEVDGVFRL